MLFDHLMCIKFVLWRKKMFSSTKAVILSLVIILGFILVNFHLIFTIKFTHFENSTFIEYLITSGMFLIWLKVDLFVYLFLPFTLMGLFNFYLLYQFKIKSYVENDIIAQRLCFKYKILNKLSFIILIIFTICCGPATIIGNFFRLF